MNKDTLRGFGGGNKEQQDVGGTGQARAACVEGGAHRAECLVVTSPGFEEITRGEMESLGLNPGEVIPGGVEFLGTREQVFRANLHLRTASRVLMRLGCFEAQNSRELARGIKNLPWEQYLGRDLFPRPGGGGDAAGATGDDQGLAVKVTSHKSRLYHTGKVEEIVLDGVGERLGVVVGGGRRARGAEAGQGAPEEDGGGGQTIYIRLDQDQCQVSLDTSGELLSRRGYREVSGVAPIRENLAAAILMGCGWEGAVPLVDPFCGTGTFILEGALMAARIPPGMFRRFAFEGWPSHGDQGHLWDAMKEQARARALGTFEPVGEGERGSLCGGDGDGARFMLQEGVSLPCLQGSDISSEAIAASRANQRRACLEEVDSMVFVEQDFQYLQPPLDANGRRAAHGLIVANPPFGDRVSSRGEVRRLYNKFAQILRDRFAGWHVGLLVPERSLVTQFPFPKLGPPIIYNHGGKWIQLLRFRVD